MSLKRAVMVLALAVTFAAGSAATLKVQEVPIQPVSVPFTVTDEDDQFVEGLRAGDFVVEEDGAFQEIRSFAAGIELPLTLVVLVDSSGSSRDSARPLVEPTRGFLQSVLRDEDRGMVVAVGSSPSLLQDLTDSTEQLASALDQVEPFGSTVLFDAVYLVSRERLQSRPGRKVILVISDGEDTASRLDRDDALRAAQEADAVIYSITFIPQSRRGGLFGRGVYLGVPGTLEDLTEETGGRAFFSLDLDGVVEALESIAMELAFQYHLTYVSTEPTLDQEEREIRIRPRNVDLRVRARRSYYPVPMSNR